MKRHFSVDWLCDKKGNFEKHLAPLAGKPDLRFLEVGSFEGLTTCYLLDRFLIHPSSEITAIDPCTFYPIPGWNHLINPGVEKIFLGNIKEYGNRVRFLKGYSQDILPTLKMDSFDFAYIDGDHRRDSVYRDAVLTLPLMKVGGIMIFDDYTWGYDWRLKDNPVSPYDGINRFLEENPKSVEALDKNNQLVARRIL